MISVDLTSYEALQRQSDIITNHSTHVNFDHNIFHSSQHQKFKEIKSSFGSIGNDYDTNHYRIEEATYANSK